MSRIINDHYVFGREVNVVASDEVEARVKVSYITKDHIWEIARNSFNHSLWEAYVASDQDCFATND